MRIPGRSWLLQETCQIGTACIKEVATPGQQATDTQRIGRNLVALGRPLARYIYCPVPSAPHQTVRAPFSAYSFPFVHSDVLRRIGCPAWIA